MLFSTLVVETGLKLQNLCSRAHEPTLEETQVTHLISLSFKKFYFLDAMKTTLKALVSAVVAYLLHLMMKFFGWLAILFAFPFRASIQQQTLRISLTSTLGVYVWLRVYSKRIIKKSKRKKIKTQKNKPNKNWVHLPNFKKTIYFS